MNRRAAFVFLTVLLVGAAAGSPEPVATAQVSTNPSLDLGYGPSTLFPISGGTPVFSSGDQLWVRSHYDSSLAIRVYDFFSNATYFLGTVEPGTPTRLLAFNATDPQGLWSIRALNSSLPQLIFLLSDAGSLPTNLTLAAAHLSGGVLDMNFTTSPYQELQDAQACTLGSQALSDAVVSIPTLVGGGTISLAMDGNTIEASTSGAGAGNFTLQVDLYYSYAFLAPNSSSILLFRSARAATTGAVLLTKSNPLGSLLLQKDGELKTGRYELRLFFEGPQGIAFATTDVLVTGPASWVWLGACQTTQVYSNHFSISASLNNEPSTWPRTLWLTYTAYGEQGFANLSLGVNLAAVTFMAKPWGVPLSAYDIRSVASSGTQEIVVQNGTMFMILSSDKASVNYTGGLGGQSFFRGGVGPIGPFTSTVVPINVSELAVTYFVRGTPHEGGTVSVSNSAGELISAGTNKNGQALFYLPAGGYNVTAAGGNSSASSSVALPFGQKVVLNLGFQTNAGTGEITLALVLGAIAIAGVIFNAIVFLRGRKRRI